MELILEGMQAVTIGGAGAEAGDVQAWRVGHVNGEGLGQHQELIFLQGWGRGTVSVELGGRLQLCVTGNPWESKQGPKDK